MNILAFAASNSRGSINRDLVEHATEQLRAHHAPQANITLLDLNDYEMPIYSIDRETENGIPPLAHGFFQAIQDADRVIVSFAEHNGFVTAAWKNIFDWLSRIDMKLWQGKPMLMLAASPGGRAGANVLASQDLLAPHFGGNTRATLGIGKWGEAWDNTAKTLTRPQDQSALADALSALIAPE